MDHDALFKWLLKDPVILRSFFEEFLPEVASYTDFSEPEYLDKEMRTLRGQRRTGDLLVKVRFKGQEAAFLIHVEHEARRDRDIAWRLLEYVVLDRRESGLPVYPVLVLAGAAGPGPERPVRMEFPDRCVLIFDFPVIELARREARDYARRQNVAALALAARMRVLPGEQVDLVVDFATTLGQSSVPERSVDRAVEYFFAYQPLDRGRSLKVRQKMSKLRPIMARKKAIRRMNPFIFIGEIRGLRRGVRRGRQTGERGLVLRLLRRRLGPLPQSRRQAIEKLSLPKIEALGEALLDFHSPEDLTRWLQKNVPPAAIRKSVKAPKVTRKP
jgi:hypothetical protein